jgi:hypothetical protein
MDIIANSLPLDNWFLALKTEKIFADLHLQKSPQSEQDLLEEYHEIMSRLTLFSVQQQKG